jgi:4-amino-4-deoxy-L-arabinose transferase-like glycosyltransferase
VATALSIRLLGQTTLAARLPFALASLITVLLLYWLALEYCASIMIASVAAVLLTLNAYWILHARQCRYYSLSSLFLALTFLCYAYWQRGGKWGQGAFIASA